MMKSRLQLLRDSAKADEPTRKRIEAAVIDWRARHREMVNRAWHGRPPLSRHADRTSLTRPLSPLMRQQSFWGCLGDRWRKSRYFRKWPFVSFRCCVAVCGCFRSEVQIELYLTRHQVVPVFAG